MRRTGLLGVGLTLLGCAGAGELMAPPAPEPPAPPTPAVVAPTSTEQPGKLDSPQLFTVTAGVEVCTWQLWDVERHARKVGDSKECPSEVRWSPDGAQILAIAGDVAIAGDWPLGEGQRVATAPNGITAIWKAPTGEIRVGAIATATVARDGDALVYTAGEESVRVPVEGERVSTYGVKGTKIVPPGKGDRDVELYVDGVDEIATFWQLGDDGAWTKIGVFPTRESTEFESDPLTVGGPLRDEEPGWTSLADLLHRNDAKGREPRADLQGNEALRAAVSADEDGDTVGFLPFGTGGFLFLEQVGDTPHAMAPLAWCADAACAAPALLAVHDGQLTIALEGNLALVTREYEGADARVFAAGNTTPKLVLPDVDHAVWAPAHAWLGPDGRTPRRDEKAKQPGKAPDDGPAKGGKRKSR